MSTSTRVIKNTWYLYFRMGITLFVGLYSTRLVLNSLGASDFGIFNVIGGSIAMMGFLNSTLANATQRFMSYAEGKGDEDNKKVIFNVSCGLHFVIALCTLGLFFAAMPLIFNEMLTIEPSRMNAAHIVYYSLIANTVLCIINVPYEAVLTAHENMLYYSVIGILESFLRLGVAFLCVYYLGDKLILYGILMACIPLITLSIMKVYCHKKYAECVLDFKRYWDFKTVRKIASFSGWNFLTAITSLLTVQGLSVVLNHFFGSIANAAQGIANQVNGQLSSFSANLMKALNPVIVKTTANSNLESINRVTLTGCKVSTLLIIFFAIPVIIEAPYILRIWLKNVPEWTVLFCRLQLIYTIISQAASPAATAVYGNGNIKFYAIYKSIMNILPIILTYFCFKFGGSPVWLYIPLIIFMGIGGDIVIMSYAYKLCHLSISDYFKTVVFPLLGVCLLMIPSGIIFKNLVEENFISLMLCCLITSIVMIIGMSWFGFSKEEKGIVRHLFDLIHDKIKKYA